MKWLYTLIIYLSFSCMTRTEDKTTNNDYYDEDKPAKKIFGITKYRRLAELSLPPGLDLKALFTPIPRPLPTFETNTYTYNVEEDLESSVPTTERKTKYVRFSRTTPFRLSFAEDCDYLAYYCMKAYQTGKVCGRTYYYMYHDFANYCMLDYVNCMERQEVWQVTHMGECFQVIPLEFYKHYPYENDYFLDQYYLLEDQVK